MTKTKIGYSDAYKTTIETIEAMGTESLLLSECVGHIAAENVTAKVNSPSADTSLKDGYALQAVSILKASAENPIVLNLFGNAAAGQDVVQPIKPGNTTRILTGAKIPEGSDTVVAEEFVSALGNKIRIAVPTIQGKNILPEGTDTRIGEELLKKGEILTPGIIGRLASGGCSKVSVFKKPKVAIIATGDEVLLPGQPLSRGKLYASNMLTLNSWCHHFGMTTTLDIVKDNQVDLEHCLQNAVETHDAIITSGGAWTGDKDLVARSFESLGWEKHYHRVRLGPGKAAGFGLLTQKPVFILPGGPPSNLVAFLMLALPGLLKLSGYQLPELPKIKVRLKQPIRSQNGWAHAEFGRLENSDSGMIFDPIGKSGSRLKSMADADALLLIPEGKSQLNKDESVFVYDLRI